ncbi:MAG: Na+:solute symporter [Bacteroidetes bacterium GWE2_41_25]|nr:MAG: Na+:solute symporter [Bacteroidetes bacterium GWE2_41_25]HCU19604.1 Na+:solute symporter [Bacteroidales bacterium]
MELGRTDWIIIIVYLVILTIIGMLTSKSGGKDSESFFLSKRNMPWWLLGFSMVATTFSIATPNLITDMVRTGGVARNWLWLSFLLSGMLTVFVYAKLWSRSRIMTDLEFYEIRYSGKTAAALRGFRALYLGFFFNVLVLAGSCLAFIKVTSIITNINPLLVLTVVSVVTVFYSSLGGLKSIIWTDFFQFVLALGGAVIPAVMVIRSPRVGGMSNLLNSELVSDKISLMPDFSDPLMLATVFIIPLTIQWWAAWYPGSEPGGGGFIAQRMLSARSEKHAVGATLFFNMMHYAVRPWPWIIVGLGSLVVFPDIASMAASYKDVPAKFMHNDIAYPIMLREFLPGGILGIVLASLYAAFMSTVSTQLNWGASYLVNDFHVRFIDREASESKKVLIGRLWTVAFMILSAMLALLLENALQAFQYMIMIGAGTGLIYLLRWFWWRINAWSEISAMAGAIIFSAVFIVIEHFCLTRIDQGNVMIFGYNLDLAFWDALKFVIIVLLNTIIWVIVTFVTKPTEEKVLIQFYEKIRPGGPGWKDIAAKADVKDADKDWSVPVGLACMSLGCLSVYCLFFATGHLIYGNYVYFAISSAIAIVSSWFLFRLWGRLFS